MTDANTAAGFKAKPWTITRQEIFQQFQISETTWFRLRHGLWADFPKPLTGSSRHKLWDRQTVYEWMRRKSAELNSVSDPG